MRVDHGADDLARGEELAAVGVLLAHLQQQVLIHLREGEEMRVVYMVDADLIHLVEDVAEVGLAVHAHALHGGHDAADDALLPAGVGVGQLGLGIDVQAVQVRQQFGVDEVEELAVALGEQFLPLPAVGLALVGLGMGGVVLEGRGPILPAERAGQRGREGSPTASAASRSRFSCASRMRRKRIHVSSGTYCRALAQFERRRMSQMDLTKADSERVPAMDFGAFFFCCFLARGMG